MICTILKWILLNSIERLIHLYQEALCSTKASSLIPPVDFLHIE